jgi:hypothetical protein
MKPTKPRKLTLPIAKLRLDGDTQPRTELNADVRREYRDLYKAGKELPPIVAFRDREGSLWVADGFHRRWGAVDAGLDKIKCLVYEGELEEARWYSYAANQGHGLRRSNDDKRKAVKAALLHPKGAKMSDRQIAEYVGVDPMTVGKYRKQMEPTVESLQSTTRTGRDGRTIDVSNIGKRQAEVEEGEAEPEEEPVGVDPDEDFDLEDEPEPAPAPKRENLDPGIAAILDAAKAWLKANKARQAVLFCALENFIEANR